MKPEAATRTGEVSSNRMASRTGPEARRMRHGTALTADRTPLAYQVHGPAAASPVLLLQGQANSHHWWDGIREAFAPEFRTITFDYRGTGATPTGETAAGDWSTSTFASDAAAVLDDLGCQRLHVYGTSMGGRVAQMLAIEHGERVDRLILACTSPAVHMHASAAKRCAGRWGKPTRQHVDKPCSS